MVGEHFPDELLTQFVDYVSYHPNMHFFAKPKFCAAISHIIISLKPEISEFFKEQMPGMKGYTSSSVSPMGNMAISPAPYGAGM